MSNEEKVQCLQEIDRWNEYIKKREEELANSKKNITQGTVGIVLGILFFILGWFFPVCFIGTVFGLVGIVFWIISFIEKPKAEADIASARVSLSQWKERLYKLES